MAPAIESSETPLSSQLAVEMGIWKGAAFRCRFQGLPAHRSIGEIKTASGSSSYPSGLTRRLRKFHLCLCIKIPPHQTHPPPPRIHPPASSALPGIRLTGESFLTGPEARSDERHNHGCSDGRIVCLLRLKTPPLDSVSILSMASAVELRQNSIGKLATLPESESIRSILQCSDSD